MLKDFREFAMRGNVIDMAVGIIIGVAFGTIVKSLVSDIIMPPIGLLLGDVDFANLFITLSGGSAGFSSSCFFSLLICLTTRNTAKTTIKKLITELTKTP